MNAEKINDTFYNPLVNVGLKFYIESLTSCTPLKVETQSIQVCWICTTFRYNQAQFRGVEVPSLGTSNGVSTLISFIM